MASPDGNVPTRAPLPAGAPPPNPNIAAGAAEGDLQAQHDEIARDIGQQVEKMIQEAKRQSESKVGKEIQKIKAKMEAIQDKIRIASERVQRLEPNNQVMLRTDLTKSIAKLEDVWENEVNTLKHELWQTIQAHNHNADLLKHHKDAIDAVQARMGEAAANPELKQVHDQLEMVEKMTKRDLEQNTNLDMLNKRLMQVQAQLASGIGHWAAGGMPPAFPTAHTAPGANAAAAAQGKKQNRTGKVPKAKAQNKGGNSMNSALLRPDAPEFVPTISTLN